MRFLLIEATDMPYVQRNSSGRINAIFQEPASGADEHLPGDHPEVENFIAGILPQTDHGQATTKLTETDISLIRVIEDIVDTLIDKNVIMFTDLPVEAREKIMQRKSTREHLFGSSDIIESEDKIF
jgi:hypothetical protein